MELILERVRDDWTQSRYLCMIGAQGEYICLGLDLSFDIFYLIRS